jgi:hypothetical protein
LPTEREYWSSPSYVPEDIAAAFVYFDHNKDGFLDSHELHEAVQSFGLSTSAAGAAHLLHRYESYPDGRLDMHDFAELIYDISHGGPRVLDGGTDRLAPRSPVVFPLRVPMRYSWEPPELHPPPPQPLKAYIGAVPAHHHLRPRSCITSTSLLYGHGRPHIATSAEVFDCYDYERRGTLDPQGLRAALAHLGVPVSLGEAFELTSRCATPLPPAYLRFLDPRIPAEKRDIPRRYGAASRGTNFAACNFSEFSAIVRDLRLGGELPSPMVVSDGARPMSSPSLTRSGSVAASAGRTSWYGYQPSLIA